MLIPTLTHYCYCTLLRTWSSNNLSNCPDVLDLPLSSFGSCLPLCCPHTTISQLEEPGRTHYVSFDYWHGQLASCARRQNHPKKLNLSRKEEVLDALLPIKALLQRIFIHLQPKGHKFETFEAAPDLQIDEMWTHITPETTTKTQVEKLERFQDFLQRHCKCDTTCSVWRHYMLSVKKCNSPSCICKPPRLSRN